LCLALIPVEAIETGRIKEKLCAIGEPGFPTECEPGARCFRTIRNSETGIASKAISVAALFFVVVVIIVSAPDVACLLGTLAR